MSMGEEIPRAINQIQQINVQVLLEREGTTTVTWIPAHFAKVGQTIALKKDGSWDEGWTVKECYSSENGHVLAHRSQQHVRIFGRRGRMRGDRCHCDGFGEAFTPEPYGQFPYWLRR